MAFTPVKDRIENDFTYHAPSPEQVKRMASIRSRCLDLARQIVEEVPDGREQSLALTSIEQVSMWANAGIARAEA